VRGRAAEAFADEVAGEPRRASAVIPGRALCANPESRRSRHRKQPVFRVRAKTGGPSTAAVQKSKVVPQWIKLSRKGNTITAYDSVDGKHWKKVGSTRINMNASVYVGLGVSSQNSSALNTTTFSDVAIT